MCFLNADIAALGAADAMYDLVLIVEAVHDLARPVAALAEAHRVVKPDGFVVVVDERTPDEFTAPSDDPVERVLYAISVLHCLPATMAQHPLALPDGAATGTVLRPSTLREYAQRAGFARVETLPAEHEMLRGYLLR
ncbi:ubiquinone/menaquinone biosynthesis C-methylase UbiE [Microbacterium immunditiarum]|uniref:Ubiquinone/menaquinone biosynthesis C-methylase UbiE n=1 Tax=Microbacterium immunditiarum TaxID=337480 RepID=A0A7Y9KLW3_9MICO|nr:ubiquinone/menaquinone biosynthesis C-methylase UbiE [Microbacterium immunditiarum]